ncbi:hypothetical protein BOX15_Mlig008670g2, partial [Macrostomum lignano]
PHSICAHCLYSPHRNQLRADYSVGQYAINFTSSSHWELPSSSTRATERSTLTIEKQSRLSQMEGSLGDLEDTVEKWAKIKFEDNKIGSQKKLSCENLAYAIDWKKVSIDHEQPEFSHSDKQVRPNAVVLFKTFFTNTTDHQQNYSFQTTRTTKKTADIRVSSTFTKGGNASITLKLPGDILELGGGFNCELAVTNERGQTFEEEISWSVNSEVSVPPKKRRSAQINITEVKYSCDFQLRSTVRGRVKVSITNPEDNNSLVKHLEADIFQVIKSTMKQKTGMTFNEATKEVVFLSKGHAAFSFGTEQHVEVRDEPLPDGV